MTDKLSARNEQLEKDFEKRLDVRFTKKCFNPAAWILFFACLGIANNCTEDSKEKTYALGGLLVGMTLVATPLVTATVARVKLENKLKSRQYD